MNEPSPVAFVDIRGSSIRFGILTAAAVVALVSTPAGSSHADEPSLVERGVRRIAAAETAVERGQWAVVVGIDEYGTNSGLRKLGFAANDAKSIHDILIDEFRYPKGQVRLLSNGEAKADAIRVALTWPDGAGPKQTDRFLFFFAGHGDQDSAGGLIAAADAEVKGRKNCIAIPDLVAWIDKIPSVEKLIVLDSCYAGELFRGRDVVGQAGPAFFGISAGRLTPVADGQGNGRNSLFTSALLAELTERADSPRTDARFTLRELASRVQSRVQSNPGALQEPVWGRLGNGDGEFWFRPDPQVPRPRPRDDAALTDYTHLLLRAEIAYRAGNLDEANRLLDGCRVDLRHWEWRYLKRLASTVLQTFEVGEVAPIAYDPSGRLLAIAGAKPRVYDVDRGEISFHLASHEGRALSVGFASDGKLLATGEEDGTVRLWDAGTGNSIATLTGHAGPVRAVAFSPDRIHLCSAGGPPQKNVGPVGPGEIFVWDLATRSRSATFVGHATVVTSVDYNHDGSRLVSAGPGALETQEGQPGGPAKLVSHPSEIRVWNTADGQPVTFFRKHPNAVTGARFSPNEARVVSAAGEDAIRIWNAASGEEVLSIPYKGYNGSTNVAFDPTGNFVAAGSLDGSTRVWDARTGAQVHEFRECHAASIVFHPRLPRLAVLRKFPKPVVQVWDTRTGREAKALGGPDDMTFSVGFHPTKPVLATASPNGSVHEWELATARDLRHLKRGMSTWVHYDPSGDRLAIGTGNVIELHDLIGGKPPLVLSAPPDPRRPIRFNSFVGAFSADGRVIAAPPIDDAKIRLWNTTTGAVSKEFDSPVVRGGAVALSPDGKMLALAGSLERPRREGAAMRDGTIWFWDLETGETEQFATGTDHVRCVVFSQDNHRLAIGALDGAVVTWRLGATRERQPLAGHTGAVASVTFSHDHRRLVSASFDRTVKVWDVSTWREVYALHGHGNVVRTADISADGKWLASAGADGIVRLWDGRPLYDDDPAAPRLLPRK